MSDWYERALDDPDYNVEDDYDEMTAVRTCEKCGCSFTLDEAFSVFSERFNGDFSYRGCGYGGYLCGDCAADEEESKF